MVEHHDVTTNPSHDPSTPPTEPAASPADAELAEADQVAAETAEAEPAEAEPAGVEQVDAEQVDAEPDDAGEAAAPAETSRGLARLEEEGEVAADYLEELLDIADLDGDIDIDVENGRAALSIVTDPVSTRALRRLVGPDGEVLEALQELTRLAVQTRTGERSRLMLDIAGHRAARRAELEKVAEHAAGQVRSTGEKVRLDPMTPFERKVVHDAIAAAGLVSESEGEEPHRRVVVLPAGE
jgi:spoIIIJ-associated protein